MLAATDDATVATSKAKFARVQDATVATSKAKTCTVAVQSKTLQKVRPKKPHVATSTKTQKGKVHWP